MLFCVLGEYVSGALDFVCMIIKFMFFRVPPVPYKCLTLGVDVQKEDLNISSITGYHHYLKTNRNVERVEIINQWWCSYLPNRFAEFFPNLLEFEARETPLKAIKRSNFVRMSKLIVLNIDGTEITSISDDTFIDLISLEELTIRKSFLTIFSNLIFSPLKSLRSFDGKHNKVSCLDEDLFSENSKLESINLTGNDLKDIRVNFRNVPNIEEIFLFNCGCINAYFLKSSAFFTLSDFHKLIQKRCRT